MVSTDAVAAMKQMASNPKKRVALAKDTTCIGGLVLVLSNTDVNIVKEALQTLLLLCECQEARDILKKHVGIVDQLVTIVDNEAKQGEVFNLAQSLFLKLSDESSKPQPLKDSSNLSLRTSSGKNRSLQSQPKAKSIVLQVRGFCDKSDRDLCARLLLRVKGVISVTFDLAKKRCILRTKLDVQPEVLVAAIAKSMTMTAKQVIRNENGEESFLSFNSSSQDFSLDKENEELPDYLSDDADTTIVEEKAVKRPTEEDKNKSAGWFSVAANFLTNSFYW